MTDRPDFDKKPFVRKHLDTSRDMSNIGWNEEERKQLDALKSLFRCDADATAAKKAMEFAHNALLGLPNDNFYRWLSEPRRLRPGPK